MPAGQGILSFQLIQDLLRGCEIEVDALLFAKNIDGVYDSDPKLNPAAKKIDQITCKEILDKDLKSSMEQQQVFAWSKNYPYLFLGLIRQQYNKAVSGENIAH